MTISQQYVEQFPILQQGLYANHASIAPWPLATTRAVREFADENSQIGPLRYSHWLLLEKRLRRALADLLNAASTDDIALLKNTTDGICTVANGIDWRRGDNVVLPEGEFPSNRLPWLALDRFGVEVREVDIRKAAIPEQALLEQVDQRTRLLSVSAVQWTDGLRLRLQTLGAACRRNNVLFFVDAIQQLGALQVDVQRCHIDYLAADGHKWLLAPEGIAVFYCRDTARDSLRPVQHGWHMLDDPYQFNCEDGKPSNTATRFEAGSPNMLGQVAMLASVELLLEHGMAGVQASVIENSRVLAEGLHTLRGAEPVCAFDSARASGIVSFKTPGRRLTEIHRLLKERAMRCSVRGDAIRLSPHFYQTGKPVQEMLQTIEDILS